MKKLQKEQLENLNGGINGTTCFAVGLGLWNPLTLPLLIGPAVACWNS